MIKINNKVVPEGYELVWEKPENTIYKDCMVAVESIALIKRKKVHGFYVRCAFRSLNEKAISVLKVGSRRETIPTGAENGSVPCLLNLLRPTAALDFHGIWVSG